MRDFFKKYWKEISIVTLLIIIVILLTSIRTSNNEIQRWEDNYNIALDSVKIIKTRNNELLYERDLYKLNYEDLDKETQKKIKNLEKELDKSVKYISKLEGNIKIDTLIIKDSVWNNNNITYIGFSYNDTWTKISGVTILDKDTITQLNSLYIDVPLTLSIMENNNKQSIIATSQNPYVSFSNIDGVILNNTPNSFKHWTLGAEMNLITQYNIFNKTLDVVPNIEVNLEYLFKNNIYINGQLGVDITTNIYKNDISPYIAIGLGYSVNF